MSNRVLWFFFGDVTYWSFAIGEEEILAGTLWSGNNTEIALENFESWLESFLEINNPEMIGLGIDASIEGHRKVNCEACYGITQLQATKHDIQTFDMDLETHSSATSKSQTPKSLRSQN